MNRNELAGLLLGNLERITVTQAALNLFAALICTSIIFAVYYLTSKEVKPTAAFAVTLLIVSLSVTVLVMLIGSNLALSLGMVGALSVIRFRAAVKDSRDAAFIFFAIAAGMACALSVYMFAFVGTLFIAAAIMLFSFINIGSVTYLLTVRMSNADISNVNREFEKIAGKSYAVVALTAKNEDNTMGKIFETVYEVGIKNDADAFCARILEIDGVLSISAVQREA